jgi:hypothetical protein
VAKTPPSSDIGPRQHKNFVYVGNYIPNRVTVKNLGATATSFRLTSTRPGWVYYGRVAGNGAITLAVHFPTGKLTVFNDGRTTIRFTGSGIRPI